MTSFSPHSSLMTHRINGLKQKYSFPGHLPENDEML